ncbi:MarR family winged helix-turn-helix transcriptional regulator [Allosalinactinospora lopnorensis]|uniref:MarR family winged helix-turn-helix transcriptional regulator n=1 Tax=Allosalinactinospora lopnorensis TaxID=1352348 RepID=UPI000623D5B0|nr:MarR family transcriptional regulator [Allosalinactinospora lopnorensis]
MSNAAGPTEQCNDPRITALGLLVDVRTGVTARLAPVFEAHGISENDFDAVLRIARSCDNALRMSDLARQAGASTSGMTRVVDRLERRGLVVREPHPTDRRVLYVRLTREGLDKTGAMLPDLLAAIDHWFTGRLPAEHLDQLLAGLRVVRDVVLPEAEEAERGNRAAAVTETSSP